MKRTIIVFSLLASFIAGIFWYGYTIPAQYHISKQQFFDVDYRILWKAISDYKNYHKWRENIYAITELPSDGKKHHYQWKEIDGEGKTLSYEIIKYDLNNRLTIRNSNDSLAYTKTWAFKIDKKDNGALLTVTEDGEINNLLLRVKSHIFKESAPYIETYLDSLRNKFIQEKRQAEKTEK